MEISPKTPIEVIPVTFNYLAVMRGDAVLSAVITCEDEFGVAQPGMLQGAPDLSGRKVVQLVSGGVLGKRYFVTCLATFSKRPAALEAVASFLVVDNVA